MRRRSALLLVGMLLVGPPLVGPPPAAGDPAISRDRPPQGAGRPEDGRVGDPPLQVFLMTMGPGGLVHERFGHNAIWIRDTLAGTDLIYNFGIFDFAAPNFVWNFVKGRPLYWLGVSDLRNTLAQYDYFQRQVEVQELALTDAQKSRLAFELAVNAEPANREYRYDYYLDNCSTRVRDALDAVLGGALRRHTEGVAAEGTYRWHTQRSLSNNPWLYLGTLAAIGARADAPLDQWEEMFLPAKVQERLRELRVVNEAGQDVPLVLREATILPHDTWRVEPTQPDWTWPLLGVGLAIAAVIATGMLAGPLGIVGRTVGVLWAVVQVAGGLLLLFLWFFTNHEFTAWNGNVLLFTPLAIALPVMLRARATRKWLEGPGVLYLCSVILGSFDGLAQGQDNSELVALMVPPSLAVLAMAVVVTRRRAAAPLPPS